jgi:chromosome segregation ATPase|tara:strand:- start:3735 stop:4232 length:498 start_codon:yes stop_codon:yes gene_type:complete
MTSANVMNDLELKIGNFTFKGIYLAIFLPIISGLAGGVWYISDFYNRINVIDSLANSNSSFGGTIEDLEARLSSVEQSIADNDISSLQGKLAELGTNLSLIMEAQKDLMDLKDQFKDVDVAAKENKLLVESYESRIKELENKIKLHQREVDDIWKGMDALANPLG